MNDRISIKELYKTLSEILSIDEIMEVFLIEYDQLLGYDRSLDAMLNRIAGDSSSITDITFDKIHKNNFVIELIKGVLLEVLLDIYGEDFVYITLYDELLNEFDSEENLLQYFNKSFIQEDHSVKQFSTYDYAIGLKEDVNTVDPVDKEIKLEDAKTLEDVVKFLVADEVSAIDGYSNAIAKLNELELDEKVRKQYTALFEHLISEEEHHINELEAGKELPDIN